MTIPVQNPYVGPRPFQTGETLYGRDQELYELLDLLIAERIVLLYSPSGAGKTSLIQAGLLPELQAEGFRALPVMRVSLDPPREQKAELPDGYNRYVLSALLSLEEGIPEDRQLSLSELARMTLAEYVERKDLIPRSPHPDPLSVGEGRGEVFRTVFIFDQFEEILTVDLTDRAAKIEFFTQLGALLRNPDHYALFAMREEFPAGLDPYLRHIPTRLNTTFRLELLGVNAAQDAMQEPARQAGIPFTHQAAAKLVNDLRTVRVQQPDGTMEVCPGLYVEPVQLQVVCRRLWDHLPEGTEAIQATHIQETGDVNSALAGYYAGQVKIIAQGTGVRERTIRKWFNTQLITDQGFRGQVLRGPEQSQGLANLAIQPLVDAHLVRAENRRGATWYELTHDRLIKPIKDDNEAWREKNLTTLQRQADLWQNQGRSGNLLLRDEALTEADQWAAEHEHELTFIERDFLEACREARAVTEAKQTIARAERERRKNRFIQGLAFVAVIFSIVAGYFYVQAHQSEQAAIQAMNEAELRQREAEKANNESLTQAVAFQSLFQHESRNDERAALLARQAYLFNDEYQLSVLHQVDHTLRTALPQHFSYILKEHENAVNSVAISPDGTRLVSGSDDKTVRLWDLEDFDGKPEKLPKGHIDRVWSVTFSPDGKMIASGSEDETVRWWILTDQGVMPQAPLKSHNGAVYSVDISPDSTILASGSHDKTVRLWNLKDPSADSIILSGHTQRVNSVAFSPDGTLLASGSDDGIVRLWDLTDPSPSSIILQGHESAVYSVAFRPDGNSLASGGADNTVRIWEPQNPDAPPYLAGWT